MKNKAHTSSPSSQDTPLLFGFAYQRRNSNGEIQIALRWRRTLSCLLVLFTAAWIGTAAALYSYFKHKKDFEAVRFTNMLLLPFRMDEHRKEMGDFHIEKGLADVKNGNYRNALRLLRLGVARSPGNLEGRRVLAEFYEIAIKRGDIATELMLAGLEMGGIEDLTYLKQTLRVLLRDQRDDKIQEIADTYLPHEAEQTNRNRILAFAAANANYLRGNYDQAEAYLMAYQLIESIEGLLLYAKIKWDRGDRDAAINQIEQSRRQFADAEVLLMQLSRYHREMGNLDKARRLAILRSVKAPLSAAPRLELLYIYNTIGDQTQEQRETQRLLKQFRSDESTLHALSNFAADTGNIKLARRTYEEALENEFKIDTFALLLIEAHLAHKDHRGALKFSEELLTENPDWLTQRWSIFNSLRAVAAYSSDRSDLGDIYLQHFIDETNTPAQTYLAVARRFNNNDCAQQAQKILASAHQRQPNHQKILSELIRANIQLGNTQNLNKQLTRFLQMRRPQMRLLVEAYQKLGSDRFIFIPDREGLLRQLRQHAQNNAALLPDLDS